MSILSGLQSQLKKASRKISLNTWLLLYESFERNQVDGSPLAFSTAAG